MKVYVLLQEFNQFPYGKDIIGVYLSKEEADTAHRAAVEDALADDIAVYWNPTTETHCDNWDEDFMVEEHEVK